MTRLVMTSNYQIIIRYNKHARVSKISNIVRITGINVLNFSGKGKGMNEREDLL